MQITDRAAARTFDALGTLLLADLDPHSHHPFAKHWFDRELAYVFGLDEIRFRDFLEQAHAQRVLRRTLEVLTENLDGSEPAHIPERMSRVLSQERKRARTASAFLRAIVSEFTRLGHPIMVMKTLDHWPDTGSDLDLLVAAPEQTVWHVMESRFDAQRQTQSWGDRLANKWNFSVPGLSELVEVHVGCLGQTGEQRALANRLLSRRVDETFDDRSFPVPMPEDRIVIATLQRMYRHFYIRFTDILNLTVLVRAGRLDFTRLRESTERWAIWPGVATLLKITSDYNARAGDGPLSLPDFVMSSARFGAEKTYVGKQFLRVPMLPQGSQLFLQQLIGTGTARRFRSAARLSLLPALAVAAFVNLKFTGDDKGIW